MSDVPKGYKQTELGVIPEDWEAVQLTEIGDFKNGINKGAEDFGYGYPFVNLMDVFGIPRLAKSENDLGLVNSSPSEREMYNLKAGDVLFVRSSVKPEGVGLTTTITKNLKNTVYSGFLIRFRPRIQMELAYLTHCFYEERFRKELIAGSTISANTNINQESLKSLLLPLPPLPEQRAIASALADVDALLASLEELLTKKRQLKQAAMQELLTGRTRLEGFEGEWDEVKLGDVVAVISGGTPSTGQPAFWNGGIPWCTPTDLTSTTGKYLSLTERSISVAGLKSSAATLLPAGAILFCSRASVGEVKIAAIETTTNQGFQSFLCGPATNRDFIYYWTILEKARFIELAKGSTFLEISSKAVKSIHLCLPPLPEQQAIASILSDMDAEIDALEQRLGKTRALKQGMMQELLTGRTRLI